VGIFKAAMRGSDVIWECGDLRVWEAYIRISVVPAKSIKDEVCGAVGKVAFDDP